MEPFAGRLEARVREVGSPACVGLDPHLDRLPPSVEARGDRAARARGVERFCRGVIEAVAGQVAAVKPQVALFEQLGAPGVEALERCCAAARQAGLLVILDAKRGDIGSTAEAYARATLDEDGPLAADAVTLSPYLGPESLAPFVSRCAQGKGLFVLVRTSNPGSGEWQARGEEPIARRVAEWIRRTNRAEGRGSVGAVVGATVPEEAGAWRARMPAAWFLVPGYGAQGATAEDVRRHARADGLGALVNSSRGVLFPATGVDGPDWPRRVAARCQRLVSDLAEVLPVD